MTWKYWKVDFLVCELIKFLYFPASASPSNYLTYLYVFAVQFVQLQNEIRDKRKFNYLLLTNLNQS